MSTQIIYGEKPIDMTDVERILYANQLRKERKREWDLLNTHKVVAYRRATTLRRCIQRCSVPTKETVKKYHFTKDELKPIFDALWNKWSSVEDTFSEPILLLCDDLQDLNIEKTPPPSPPFNFPAPPPSPTLGI